MTLIMTFIVAISLGLGNFVYEFADNQDWMKAVEHTFFQACACLFMYAADYLNRRVFGGGV